MLKSRIVTALILAPSVIAAIYLLPLSWFALVFCAFATIGANEFAGLAGITARGARVCYVAAFAVLCALSWRYSQLMPLGVGLGCLTGLLAIVVVITYPRSKPLVAQRWLVALVGVLISWAAWTSLTLLRAAPDGAHWVLWLLVLVWAADIGAYFVGRRFGQRKLASAVSPGKTWEGAFGGLLLSGVVSLLLLSLLLPVSPAWVLLTLGLIVLSVFGDLFESVLKRVRGVKDSGTLLPGHGGILDRIDSLVAVLPWLTLALLLTGLSDIP